ncbi:signal peptidase I [Patescibacteria group bacterium]|nr:signal peptidase I [Patescibacteria group bacterium]
MRIKSILFEIFETFFVSLVVLLIINTFIGAIEQVWGASMEPAFYTGERILVEKISKGLLKFNRGEVVIINAPSTNGKHYIKRIVGLPGDIVKIYDCSVYILRDGNKYKLDEPYIPSEECTRGGNEIRNGRSIRIQTDQYMVLGDNRDNSVDSRVFGFLTKDDIVGRVVFRFWPLSRLSFIS